MQGNFKMERQLCDELLQNLEPSLLYHACKVLVNDTKSVPAGRVIIFSDEKTWTVDPVRNRRNVFYLSLGEEDESART